MGFFYCAKKVVKRLFNAVFTAPFAISVFVAILYARGRYMARKISIISGKGGVGKSTLTANLGYAIAKRSKRVLLVDLDFGLNSLDLLLSCRENVVFDVADVLEKKCRLKQALISDPNVPNLYCLLSGSFNPAKNGFGDFSDMIMREESAFDYVFFDCSAGVGSALNFALKASEEVIIVVTPHYICIKDALRAAEYAKRFSPVNVYAVINRVRGDLVKSGYQAPAQEIFDRLGVTPLGVVPERDDLNGFVRGDSEFFDVLADNLTNGTMRMYDCVFPYGGLLGKIKCKLKRNV